MGFLSGLFGGGQGEYYQGGKLENTGTQALAKMLESARGAKVEKGTQDLVGGASLADALKGMTPDEVGGLATGPVSGNIVAQQQAMNDPLLAGTFGAGGQRDRAMKEEERLSTQGYKLQPEDFEAYGQASGNIARQFGQQEQSLASALANRGLAAGGSGATGAAFTGMQGNKNEQLAKMQTDIADKRMQNTMQRLTNQRNFIGQLNSTGLQAENQNFAHNMSGYENRAGMANNLASNERGDFDSQERVNQASMQSKNDNKEQGGLGDALVHGALAGVSGGVTAGIGSSISSFLSPKKKEPQPTANSAGGDNSRFGNIV